MSRRKTINWDLVPLGQEPDNRLANKLGVSTHAVRKARQDRFISAFVPEGKQQSNTQRLSMSKRRAWVRTPQERMDEYDEDGGDPVPLDFSGED